MASPHTRGWTLRTRQIVIGGAGFPAHAGMDPPRLCRCARRPRLPRTRGDGPMTCPPVERAIRASPHTRGWTHRRHLDDRGRVGFPAHAGMDLRLWRVVDPGRRLPRTRGDGPRPERPADAGGMASPHTRGWTRPLGRFVSDHQGFPAHAGMDPGAAWTTDAGCGLPRTRGDGPRRGASARGAGRASPHTRGWTLKPGRRAERAPGFPAHAGMDPDHARPTVDRRRLPRTRGDGPRPKNRPQSPPPASPHTRGWTRRDAVRALRVAGFPAHAGMDPTSTPALGSGMRLPRTRGDGPHRLRPLTGATEASPHTRGWTASKNRATTAADGFPAHAGMDPS